MVCESDVAKDQNSEGDDGSKSKNYTRVLMKASEEERKRIREMINKQKKRNIQKFL
jgi:hypothetical protein